MCPDIKRISN